MTDHKMDKDSIDYFERRKGSMKLENTSFVAHWKQLGEFIQPRRGRFFTSDRNKGNRRFSSIINSKASQAKRSSQAGIFAGTMSPARPWFKLGVPDPDLMKRPAVKQWLSTVEELMRDIFNAGNLYAMAPTLLGELLIFGTGAMSHVDDFQDVARFYTHTVGGYMVAQNDRFVVDTICREFEYTTQQMVGKFGLKNVSIAVKRAWDSGNYDTWHKVTHFVEPNPNFDPTSKRSAAKRFRSVYYDTGDVRKDKFLELKGFHEFPTYVPRWDVTGEDIYGTDSPAMTALGDIRGLQVKEKRKAQGIEKQINPPLHGPSSLRNANVSGMAGGLTIYEDQGGQGLKAVYEVKPDISGMIADIEKTERIIDEAFFVDLFLAISRMEGIQPKNEFELSQRNAERLLQLGPVLERIHGELLDKLIDRMFAQMVRAGILPIAPPELQGSPIKITYISTLAQAQKAVATTGIERVFGFAGSIAQLVPSVLDNLDADEAMNRYADIIGVPPSIIRDPVKVVAIRKARAAAEANALAVTTAAESAKAVKDGAQGVKALTEAANV